MKKAIHIFFFVSYYLVKTASFLFPYSIVPHLKAISISSVLNNLLKPRSVSMRAHI